MIKCKYLDCGYNIQGQCITKPEFSHGKCISSAYDIYDELYGEIEEYWHEFIEDKNFQEFIGMNDEEYKKFTDKNKKNRK